MKKFWYGNASPSLLRRIPSAFNCKVGFFCAFLVMILMTPPIASEPYLALAAPWITSIRSTFSVPSRWTSSAAPEYLSKSPSTGWPSTRISVWRASAPRMDTPTRPIASTVLDTPVWVNIISSTDFACFFSISFLVMICTCCEFNFASSSAHVPLTWTTSVVTVAFSAHTTSGALSHKATALDRIMLRFACPHRFIVPSSISN